MWHQIHVVKQRLQDLHEVRGNLWLQAPSRHAGGDLPHQAHTDVGQLPASVTGRTASLGEYHPRHVRRAAAGSRGGLNTPVHLGQPAEALHGGVDASLQSVHVIDTEAAEKRAARVRCDTGCTQHVPSK